MLYTLTLFLILKIITKLKETLMRNFTKWFYNAPTTKTISKMFVLLAMALASISCTTLNKSSKGLTQAKIDYYNEYAEVTNSETPYKYPDNMSELNLVLFDAEEKSMSFVYTIYLHKADRTEEQWKNIRYSLVSTVTKNVKNFHDELHESFREDGITLMYFYTDLDDNLIQGILLKPGEY